MKIKINRFLVESTVKEINGIKEYRTVLTNPSGKVIKDKISTSQAQNTRIIAGIVKEL